jgi:hypothetical protein
MTVWAKAFAMATALIVLVLGAGCAVHPAEPVPTAEVADAVHCVFGDQEGPAAGRVPSGFNPVEVYRCNIHATLDDTEGRWSAVVIERLTGDLGPLLRALARPDDARTDNPCPAMAELVPDLWLADASGHAVRVHYPRTSCGFTKPAVRAALDVLTVVDTRTEKVQLIEPRVALDAGMPAHAATEEVLRLVS